MKYGASPIFPHRDAVGTLRSGYSPVAFAQLRGLTVHLWGVVVEQGSRMRAGTERAALLGAAAAVIGLALVVGCSAPVEGHPQENRAQAAEYAAEVTSSMAAASSSQKAADELAALEAECALFLTRAGDTIDSYNAFIDAANTDAADAGAKAAQAVGALRSAADRAEEAGPALPPDLAGLFVDYAATYRDLASAVESGERGDYLNTLAGRGDELRDSIRAACPTS